MIKKEILTKIEETQAKARSAARDGSFRFSRKINVYVDFPTIALTTVDANEAAEFAAKNLSSPNAFINGEFGVMVREW